MKIVKAIITYFDKRRNQYVTPDDPPFEVSDKRAKELLGKNKNNVICVKVVQDDADDE